MPGKDFESKAHTHRYSFTQCIVILHIRDRENLIFHTTLTPAALYVNIVFFILTIRQANFFDLANLQLPKQRCKNAAYFSQ